jgi:hypothetical protein
MFRPAKATLGYPTQSAAIAALLGAGLTVKEVAARIGCSAQSVYVQQSKMRERARKAAGSAKASTSQVVWTPEKQAKARRLFGQSMVLIADALQVPPQEFLRMMLKGAQPQDDVLKALPAPSVAELSRDDDEAELAALEQEQQDEIQSDGTDGAVDDRGDADVVRGFSGPDAGTASPPVEPAGIAIRRTIAAAQDEAEEVETAAAEPEPEASAKGLTRAPSRSASLADEIVARHHGPRTVPAPKSVAGHADPMAMPMATSVPERFKLRDEAGAYLHEHERGMTRVSRFIWRGTAAEVKSLKRKKPHLRALIEEVAIG